MPTATAERIRLRLLDGVCLERDGAAIGVAGTRQRALLAYLALRSNTPVSTDELLDRIWGSDGAVASLRVAVSKLRRLLDETAVGDVTLETRPGAYLLHAVPGAIDVDVFEDLASRGRAALAEGSPETAARLLREALSLWRTGLGELRDDALAADAALLEEQRASVLEDCLEAELAGGRGGDLVAELRQLVAAHPLRERFRMQLMLALYRNGRQQESLDVYRDTRALFAREFGLEPSPELQRLERLVLAQDPDLGPIRTGVALSRRATRGRWFADTSAAALVAAAGVAFVVSRDGAPRAVSTVPANSVAALDPRTGGVTRVVAAGRAPRAVVVADGALWVASFGDQTVSRVDLRSGKTETVAATGAPATALAFGAADVWVADRFDGALVRLDGRTAQVLARIAMPAGITSIAAGPHSVWVTNEGANALYRVDPRTNRIVDRVRVPAPAGVVVGEGGVWVAESLAKSVVRIDPRTDRVDEQIALDLEPDAIAVAGGVLWATHPVENVVSRVDLRTRAAQLVQVGRAPSAVAAESGEAWVVADLDHEVDAVDARTGVVDERLVLSRNGDAASGGAATTPGGIALGAGRVWVSVDAY